VKIETDNKVSSGRVEQRREPAQVNGFQGIRPFELRGKRPSDQHFVSSAPSKIPYGGFSPVRLQAGCQPCPSPPFSGFDTTTVEISSERVLFRSRALAQAARTASDTTHPPSGPWLRRRLFCPPASSLTMATSELLSATASFRFMPAVLRRTEVPQFTLPELDSVPPSLLRWLQDADRRVGTPDLAFAHPVGTRQPQFPHIRTACGLLTKRQHSRNAAARNLASPAPDRTFTTELACGRSLFHTSVMTT
jgi:hypothetical protein